MESETQRPAAGFSAREDLVQPDDPQGTEEGSVLVTFLDMSCSLSFVILSSYCFSLSNTFYAYSVSVQLDAGCSRTGIFFFWSVLYTSASLAFRISARLRGKGNINLF